MENQYLHQFIYSNIQGAARLRTKEAVEAVLVPCSWRLWRPTKGATLPSCAAWWYTGIPTRKKYDDSQLG